MASNSPVPGWFSRLYGRYSSSIAQVFLMTGNTRDYAAPGRPLLPAFLDAVLSRFDVVAFYNRASGVSFTNERHEARFLRRAGVAGSATPPGQAARPPREPMAFFPAADRALKYSGPWDDPTPGEESSEGQRGERHPMALIIEYPETLFPATMNPNPEERNSLIFLQRWALDEELSDAGGLVILIGQTSSDVHPAIRAASSRIEHVEVPMPNYEDRLEYVEHLGMVRNEIRAEEVAAKTAGLTLLHIEDIKLRAGDEAVTRDMIRERKDEIIRSELSDIVGSDDPDWGLEQVGGLDEAKAALMANVVRPLQLGKLRRVPLGVLLIGPPGTGKTYLVKAMAHDAGVNYLELDFGRMQDSLVGQSERNLERVLNTIEASTPCIVFVDEIDQALRRGTSGLNPVQDNIFGRMLRFLSDPRHRGRMVFIAATNRPDLLDPALKRAGRFDLKVPILPPDAAGRMDALRKLVARYSPGPGDVEDAIRAVAEDRTEGWVPAELETLVVKAVELADDEDREVIEASDLRSAAESLRPATTDTAWMTDLAIAECSDIALLPERYQKRLDDRKALAKAIERGAPTGRGRREAPELASV